MIFDKIAHWETYTGVNKYFLEGMEFALSLKEKSAGRYEHGKVFAMVQEGNTRGTDTALFEYHEKYVDVQIMLQGKEMVGWCDRGELVCKDPFDVMKDIGFGEAAGQNISIEKGMFYVVFPHDAHRPCTHDETQTYYRKIVLKLPAE